MGRVEVLMIPLLSAVWLQSRAKSADIGRMHLLFSTGRFRTLIGIVALLSIPAAGLVMAVPVEAGVEPPPATRRLVHRFDLKGRLVACLPAGEWTPAQGTLLHGERRRG